MKNEVKFNTVSDEAKDEIFDQINQIFHEAAFVWQVIEQGDPEESLDGIERIRNRIKEVESQLEAFRIKEGGK